MKNLKIETRGRAPIGPRAMTSAERQRRYRLRLKATRKARSPRKQPKSAFDWATVRPIGGDIWQECCRRAGLKVPDAETSEDHALWISSVARTLAARPTASILGNLKGPLRQLLRCVPALVERFRAAEKSTPPRDSYPHLEMLLGSVGQGLTCTGYPDMARLEACDQLENGARYLLDLYADDGPADWRDLAGPVCGCAMGEDRRSVTHDDDPLCVFVHLILAKMGITGPSISTVTAVLRGRRGRRSRK
jgi:hypothetical protein